MSGQALGWVLRHGPPDKAMRAVLVVIGDAANRDGEHSHPGLQAMIESSLYSRSAVLRALAELRIEGWIVVEEESRRGRFTVFRIPGVTDPSWTPNEVSTLDLNELPDEVSSVDLIERPLGSSVETSTDPMRSQPRHNEVSGVRPHSAIAPCIRSTVLENGLLAADAAPASPTANGSTKVTETDPVKAAAHRLAVLAFEQPVKPVTRGGFPAVMARLEQALRASFAEADLARAIRAGPVTWTANGLTAAVSMSQPRRRSSSSSTGLRMIQEGRRP